LPVAEADHTGAFGSGAGFAMQDGWLLAQIIQHFQTSAADVDELLTRSLELFDSIRSPYYAKMYDYLDGPKNNIYGKGTTLSPDPAGDLYWIYGLDIRAQWEEIERALLDTWLPHLVYVRSLHQDLLSGSGSFEYVTAVPAEKVHCYSLMYLYGT
jgi:hypothetical protein